MLQIKDIRKTYVTGELVQTALDGVSLNLRDNGGNFCIYYFCRNLPHFRQVFCSVAAVSIICS